MCVVGDVMCVMSEHCIFSVHTCVETDLQNSFFPHFFCISFQDFNLQNTDRNGVSKKRPKKKRNDKRISGIISYELNTSTLDTNTADCKGEETSQFDSNNTEIVPKRKQVIVSVDGMLTVLDLVSPCESVFKGSQDILSSACAAVSGDFSICFHALTSVTQAASFPCFCLFF